MKLSKNLKKILQYWKSLIWIAFILYGTLIPKDRIPDSNIFQVEYVDWIMHFILFSALMSLLLMDARYIQSSLFPSFLSITFILLCFILAICTEAAQHFFIRGRSGNFFDFLFDMLGALCTYYAFRWYKMQKRG